MSVPWAKNLVGFSLSEEEMKDIPYPATELTVHVTIKDIQAFGLLGTLVFAPLSAAFKQSTRNRLEIKSRMVRFGRIGMLSGLVVGPLMTYMRLRGIKTTEEVYDRCYRLRNNRGQVIVDRASIVGFMVGGVIGMPVGVLGAALFNAALPANPKQ